MIIKVVGIGLVMIACFFIVTILIREVIKLRKENLQLVKDHVEESKKFVSERSDLLIENRRCLEKQMEMRQRIVELEDGVKEAFGVSVRNEVTKVECVFNKTEMAFIMAGVHKLIKNPDATIDDREYYIKLYKKIQSHIGNMDEEETAE